jgi:hypothetical protein
MKRLGEKEEGIKRFDKNVEAALRSRSEERQNN